MDGLRLSGFTRIFRPSHFGGRDIDLRDYLDALVSIARIDASAAWCLGILNVSNWLMSGLFPDPVLARVFADSERGLIVGSMAVGNPCQVTAKHSSYVVSGKWGFVSGCDHADWVFVKAPAAADRHIILLVPRAACRLGDDWQFAGLRGTGSKSVFLDSVEVPAEYTCTFDDQHLARGVPPERDRRSFYFRLPSRVLMRLPITAVAIGVAERALALFEDNISHGRPNGFVPRDLPQFQSRFAESQLDIELARLLLDASVARATDTAWIDGAKTPLGRARIARNLVQAVHLCRQAVDRIVVGSGARQMFRDSPLYRMFEDINAIAMHFSCDRDRAMSNYAKVRLGLDMGDEVL